MGSPFMGTFGLEWLLLAAGSLLAFWQRPLPPDFPPSDEVHITASTEAGSSSSGGPNWFAYRGFELKRMIATAYRIDPGRIDIPAELGDQRYDFVAVLPQDKSDAQTNRLIQEGIKKHFHLTMMFQSRPTDVYVLSAPNPLMKPLPEDSLASHLGQAQMAMVQGSSGGSIGSMGFSGGTMDQFCLLLGRGLSRPVLNETHLQGGYDIEVLGEDIHTTDQFLQRLREKYGLVVAPARREVKKILVVGPRQL
jgi:uncharacterized protein (TIGR03435 family)